MQVSAWTVSTVLNALWLVVGVCGSAGVACAAPAPCFESVAAAAVPRGAVAALAQDAAGFIWVATGDGLLRFDGYRSRPQGRDTDTAAARNLGWIQALLPTRDGRLWIATEAEGLAVYDPAVDRVSLHASSAARRARIDAAEAVAPLRALAEGADGSIWAGSGGEGLLRFEARGAGLTTYRHTATTGSLPNDRVQALVVDRAGTLWVGTAQGLSRRGPAGEDFEPVRASGLAAASVQALFQAADGRIWVGTQQGGVAVLDAVTAQGPLLATGGAAVTGFAEQAGGPIWVGRQSGIDLLDPGDGRLLQRLRHDRRDVGGLAGAEVTALLRDQAGAIWVGGLGLGLQRHNPVSAAIRVQGPSAQAGNALASGDVRALVQRADGEIWAAVREGGVARLDAGLQVIGPLAAVSASVRVEAMALAAQGGVWLAAGRELLKLDGGRRVVRRVAHDIGPVRRLLSDRTDVLWVGTEDGLYRLEPAASVPRRVEQVGGAALAGAIYALSEAPDGGVWVGAAVGLFRIAGRIAGDIAGGGDGLTAVVSPPGAGLGNPSVIGLLFDRAGNLWADTAVTGLHRSRDWRAARPQFERISERHGVVSRPFGVNLLEDGRGRIWTHMHVYDPALDGLGALNAADGVVDFGTGWFGSYTALRDGRLLFGGSEGLLVVTPQAFEAAAYLPPLVVSELRVGGARQWTGAFDKAVRLAPGQREVSVEFAVLDYSDPGRVRYRYRLDGVDEQWINTGAGLRSASYSNLSPGDYRLRVSAMDRAGVWRSDELAIPVQVLPAWWQQSWFRGVALTLLVGLAYGLLRARTRHLVLAGNIRARAAALEEMSLTDPLTGLHNRRFLSERIEADVALSLRRYDSALQRGEGLPPDADLVFFLIDIDHFKQVNDLHRHAGGDAVLRQIRARLTQVFRDSDYLVRWGGEEFLVVARSTARAHAAGLAERMRAAVADMPFVLDDGSRLACTCSLGFAAFPLAPDQPHIHAWAAVLDLADSALFAAKHKGRNGWVGVQRATGDFDAQGLRTPARWGTVVGLEIEQHTAQGMPAVAPAHL